MRKILILIFCLVLAGCSKTKTASTDNIQTNTNVITSASPTDKKSLPDDDEGLLLKPVTPKVKLNSKQKKNLDETLPLKVREILEKSDGFEVLAEVLGEDESDSMGFYPNRLAVIKNESEKKEILESFYLDASAGPNPSACFVPHHGLRAVYQGKTVKVVICYQCHLFSVKSSFGEFDGGLPYENPKSESILNRIIQNQNVEIEQKDFWKE